MLVRGQLFAHECAHAVCRVLYDYMCCLSGALCECALTDMEYAMVVVEKNLKTKTRSNDRVVAVHQQCVCLCV